MCSLQPEVGEDGKTYGGAGHDVAQRSFICMREMRKEHNLCKKNNLQKRPYKLLECLGIFTSLRKEFKADLCKIIQIYV